MKKIAIIFICILCSISCNKDDDNIENTETTITPVDLTGTSWKVLKIEYAGQPPASTNADDDYIFSFQSDGIILESPSNRCTGIYTSNNLTINIDSRGCTEMASSFFELELLSLFPFIGTFYSINGELVLETVVGSIILEPFNDET